MVIDPCVTFSSSRRYRGDSVGSGTTDIFASGASPGDEERPAPTDTDAASAALANVEPSKSRIHEAIFSSPIAKRSIVCARRTSLLIFELIRQTDAAARIVFRSGAEHRARTISQSGLQLQVLGQIHVCFELTGTRRALLRFNVDAPGDVAPGLDAGAGVLSSRPRGGGGVARARADTEAIQPQAFLQFDQRIEAAVAAHTA